MIRRLALTLAVSLGVAVIPTAAIAETGPFDPRASCSTVNVATDAVPDYCILVDRFDYSGLQQHNARATAAVTTLTTENTEQFFELQELRPRAVVAESKLTQAQAKIARQEQRIARLRAKLAARR